MVIYSDDQIFPELDSGSPFKLDNVYFSPEFICLFVCFF